MKTLNDLLKQETISKTEFNNLGIEISELDLKTQLEIISKFKQEKEQGTKTDLLYKRSVEYLKIKGNSKKDKEYSKIRKYYQKNTIKYLNKINTIKDSQEIESFLKFYKSDFVNNDLSLYSVCGHSTSPDKKLIINVKLSIIKEYLSKKKK